MSLLNKILFLQIYSIIFILVDMINPNFYSIMPSHTLEYVAFIILVGSSISLIIRKHERSKR